MNYIIINNNNTQPQMYCQYKIWKNIYNNYLFLFAAFQDTDYCYSRRLYQKLVTECRFLLDKNLTLLYNIIVNFLTKLF